MILSAILKNQALKILCFGFIFLLGQTFLRAENVTALDSITKVHIDAFHASDSVEHKVRVLQDLGLYYLQADLNRVVSVASQIQTFSQENSYDEGGAAANNLYGMYHERLGSFDKAVDHYLQAIAYFDSVENDRSGAYVRRNLASCYQVLGENQKAIEELEISIVALGRVSDSTGLGYAYNTLGNIYSGMGATEKALSTHQTCYAIANAIDDSHLITISALNVANNMDYREDYDEIRSILERCQGLFELSGDRQGVAVALNNMGAVEMENDRFSQGVNYYLESTEIALEIDFKPLLLDNYKMIQDGYEKTGDYKKAIEYANLNNSLQAEMVNETNMQAVSELEVKYNTEKTKRELAEKENNIRLLEADKKHGRFRFMALLVMAFLALIAIGFTFWIYRQRKNLTLIKQGERIKVQIQEINFLREKIDSQINLKKIPATERKLSNINEVLETPLSSRELEVLSELSTGKTNKEISAALNVSVNTVKTHLLNIYVKLDVSNRTHAVRKLDHILS